MEQRRSVPRTLVVLALLGLLGLTACIPPRPVSPTPPTGELPSEPGPEGGGGSPDDAPRVRWQRVARAADLPPPPAPGSYQVHLIDVGTGLAVLVRGADFAMLYDAGTNDAGERPTRVTSYLAAAIGPSGDETCVPGQPAAPTRQRLDHVVLSHPHLDHASALELVLHCYDVARFWDAGRLHDRVFYRELLAAIALRGVPYHSAAEVAANHTVTVKGLAIKLPRWQRFSEGDVVELGAGARFTILHANAKQSGDPNGSSLVLAVELGTTRVLLVGDAESGPRKDPTYPAGDVELHLLDHHAAAIRADILQVGHHGSMTSSRREFLEAVRPRIALVSSGPRRYGKITLPDREVLEELTRIGATVLRTDDHDAGCPETGRLGGDVGPGGCDAWVLTIEPVVDRPR